MGRISRGWKLTKLSLRVVRKDKEILLLPLLSGLTMMLILASFVAGIFFAGGFEGGYAGIVLMILFYFVGYFVTIFFNAAIISCAHIRLGGGDPKVRDGLRVALDNVWSIFVWAIFAATVGMIIRSVQQRVGIVGKIVMGALGVAWSLVTYFVVPVLIYEKLGPWAAVKRSASLFKGTWGEMIVGNLGLSIIFILLGLPGILFILLGALVGGVTGLLVGLAIAAIYWVLLAVVQAAAEGVLVAALYRYATTGKIPEGMEGVRFANPWTR